MKIDAKLYDGKSSKEHSVQIEFLGNRVIIKEFNIDVHINEVKISSRLGNIPRVLKFPGGVRCKSEQNDKIDAILKTLNIKEPIIYKLEKSWKLAFASIALIAFVIVFMLTIGSDYTANFLADKLPQNSLNIASKNTLKHLDKHMLHKSNLSKDKKEKILALFNKIKDDKKYKLHFRSAPAIGPNAFALPSGDIVILDELVLLDKDKNLYGVLGVLAHEKAHIVYKHSLKNLIKSSIATAVISYVTGDINFIVSALPTMVITNKYSQNFETQADVFAKKELKKLNISTKPLAKLFIAMQKEINDRNKKENETFESFFSTHPLTKKRIEFFMKD